MNYSETLAYLYASIPAFHQVGSAAYKPGLQNTLRLMEHLNNPHNQFRSIHVAGTNGKGSTSHLLAAVFQAAGYKVGLYTSPHLVDFRERIRINGIPVPEEYVVQFVANQKELLETIQPSFFETTMAMAFAYFAEQQVDMAIIETGLGGRLDATNIILPELSVITNIGMDHTEFLGQTLPEIAQEKAGIIKPSVPVVIGETHVETKSVFEAKAHQEQAPISFADACEAMPTLPCQLHGIYQSHNKQTVFCALQQMQQLGWNISEEAIREGFAHVCDLTGLRGRWEKLADAPLTICDTGHNSHGIQYVAEQLHTLQTQRGGQLYIVFGMVNDKDIDVVLDLLSTNAHYLFTQAQTHRAIPAADLQKMAKEHGLQGDVCPSVKEALVAAKHNASPNDIIFIGGSNYVVGEALQLQECEG